MSDGVLDTIMPFVSQACLFVATVVITIIATEFLGENALFPVKRLVKQFKNYISDTAIDVQFNMKFRFSPHEAEDFEEKMEQLAKALKATKSKDRIILTINEQLLINHSITWMFDEREKNGERELMVSQLELQSISKIRYRTLQPNFIDLQNSLLKIKTIILENIKSEPSFPSLTIKLRKNLDLSPLLKEFSVRNLRIDKGGTQIEIWDNKLVAYNSLDSETIQLIKKIFIFS